MDVYNGTLPNFAPSHSHPLPATLTHPHPFFNKNSTLPPIFQEKQPTTTHFSTKTTHSFPYFDNNDPRSPIFQEKNPLSPIFWQKRHTATTFSTKTIDSHPFLNKNHPFPNFSIKQPTPIQGLSWIGLPATLTHSQQLLPTLTHFYPFTLQFSTKATCFDVLSY